MIFYSNELEPFPITRGGFFILRNQGSTKLSGEDFICYTAQMTQIARIGVDCRLSGPQHAGIGRYIENLVTRLPNLAPEVHWIYFFTDQSQADHILSQVQTSQTSKIAPKVTAVLAPHRHYSMAEQLKMPGIFEQQHLDLLHVPHFNLPLRYKGRVVITIHDLLWHEYKGTTVTTLPAWQYWLKYNVYLYTVTQAVKRASTILVPAETIHQTVVRYYPSTASKVVVTKEGIDEHFLELCHKITSTKKSPAQQNSTLKLLYIGSLYPHKNVRLVIEALHQLPNYELLIVGTRNVFQEQLRQVVHQHGLDKQVQFLGFVPDAELVRLCQTCQALVQPSFSEGFGLTGVEAMAAQLPVLASDIPIFREIYQDAAIYFDPYSVPAFVQAVQTLASSDQHQLIQRGYHIAQQYSWDKMAEETWHVYQQALSLS